jgi:ribosomal protein S14
MSLRSKVSKDKKLRYCFFQNEFYILLYKSILKDSFLDNDFKFFIYLKLFRLINNRVFSSRIRNRCVVTGRARGVNRFFKMSRLLVRSKSSQGLLTGVKKSSW